MTTINLIINTICSTLILIYYGLFCIGNAAKASAEYYRERPNLIIDAWNQKSNLPIKMSPLTYVTHLVITVALLLIIWGRSW